MILRNALDRYLLQLEADGRSRHTVDQRRRHVLLLEGWLAGQQRDRDMRTIDHEALAHFLVSPAARTRSDGAAKRATSVNALRSSLRAFFSYALHAGIVAMDPSRLIRPARCGPRLPKALVLEQEERLLTLLDAATTRAARRDRALFRFLLRTGTRLGATLALRVEDIDLDHACARLRASKGDCEEIVVLPRETVNDMRTWMEGRSSGPLFPGPHGEPLSARRARSRLAHWLRQAEIRGGSPHTLRHTFATSLYRRTGDVRLVQRALGHRAIASTLVYAHADVDRLRSVLDQPRAT